MTEWEPPTQEELAERFGRLVREERRRRGWRQQDVADRLDVSPPYLSQIENGGGNVTLGTISKFARIFNRPAAWFLRHEEHPLQNLFRDPPPFDDSRRFQELATLGRRTVDREPESPAGPRSLEPPT